MGLIAIDPGVHSMAIAVFEEGGILLDAWNEASSAFAPGKVMGQYASMGMILERWGSPSVWLVNRLQRGGGFRIVGERQVVYPGAKGMKTNPNDLLDLAMCSGAFYGALCAEMGSMLTLVEPAKWKAQVPKNITRERIEKLLMGKELNVIKKGGEMHNVYDAIGIGLFALGRAKKGMVAP